MNEIQKLEQEVYSLSQRLEQLRRDSPLAEVKNYTFKTETGDVTLRELFGEKEILFAIHNMGQGCRYCTLWADGLNGFLPHLEEKFAVALLSKDAPELQRRFANSRGWRYRMASHGGGDYLREQTVSPEQGEDKKNYPGMVCYIRKGDKIFRKNSTVFGPGDQFCSLWPILSLAGLGEEQWHPQFNYWKMPAKLDDGGANVN
jgi:predicted dithiol-disulfide oxidoreductase (DUF899 family)